MTGKGPDEPGNRGSSRPPGGTGGNKRDWIASQLKRVYDEALDEAIPSDMLELLSKLDEAEEGEA